MEKQLYQLQIDPELEKIAPDLTESELNILIDGILEMGCISPLIVWGETIVDGHNRYRICHENNIPFGIEQIEFADKTQAKLWIVENQLGRRNLTPFQRCEMVLPLEDELKEEGRKNMAEGSGKTKGLSKLTNLNTRKTLAKMAGVADGTIYKVRKLINEADEETLGKLRTGKIKIHSAYMKLQNTEESENNESLVAKPEVEVAGPESTMVPRKANTERPDDDNPLNPSTYDDLPYKPTTYLEKAMVIPESRDTGERKEYPFPYVRDQVWSSVEGMVRGVEIAMNWLAAKDHDKADIMLDLLEEGVNRARTLIKEACK